MRTVVFYLALLQVACLALKSAGAAAPWWVVFAPTWILPAFAACVLLGLCCYVMIAAILSGLWMLIAPERRKS
jgi:hypothetical protein